MRALVCIGLKGMLGLLCGDVQQVLLVIGIWDELGSLFYSSVVKILSGRTLNWEKRERTGSQSPRPKLEGNHQGVAEGRET